MIFKRIKKKFIKNKIISSLAKVGQAVSFDEGCHIIGGKNICIGNNFSAGKNLQLQTWQTYRGKPTGFNPSLVIGDNVSIMTNCHISCINKIEIGDGCLFGDNVFITDNFHGDSSAASLEIMPIKRELYSKGPVVIGKNVWIGRNVCIMPGVTIGDGVVIGANSVVTHSFPENCIIAGAPAKIIKTVN